VRLTAKIHGVLDYMVVAFLFASPVIFRLPTTTALCTYAIGVIHLVLTLTTDFPMGVFKIIPLKIHGMVELIVSISLVGIAFLLERYDGPVAYYYYLGFASAVFITWLISDYRNADA